MPPDMTSTIADYGLAGIIIVVLVWIIHRFIEDMKQVRVEHKDERDEWRESDQKRHEETTKTVRHFTDAVNRLDSRHRLGDKDAS